MNSPFRIAVAVLGAGLGWAAAEIFSWPPALIVGLVAGLIAAQLLPRGGGSCGIGGK